MAVAGAERPLLIIVSGAPGTGKTTLARRLSERLSMFLLTRDDLKETLGDSLPSSSVSGSRALGRAAFRLPGS